MPSAVCLAGAHALAWLWLAARLATHFNATAASRRDHTTDGARREHGAAMMQLRVGPDLRADDEDDPSSGCDLDIVRAARVAMHGAVASAYSLTAYALAECHIGGRFQGPALLLLITK